MKFKVCTFTNPPDLLFYEVCRMLLKCLNVHSIWKECICPNVMYLLKIMTFCMILIIFWCISLKTNTMKMKLHEKDLIHHIYVCVKFAIYKVFVVEILIYVYTLISPYIFDVIMVMIDVDNELFWWSYKYVHSQINPIYCYMLFAACYWNVWMFIVFGKECICQGFMYLIKIMKVCVILETLWCISLETNTM